jgi:hypothetical protein
MATVRQYFETDFPHVIRIWCHVEVDGLNIEACVMFDFSGFTQFTSVYVPGEGRSIPFYKKILERVKYGKTTVFFDQKIDMPDPWYLPGEIQILNDPGDLQMNVRFHGDARWISWKQLPASRRVFIYSESDFSEHEILKLELEGMGLGHDIQFRSPRYAMKRSQSDRPVAFISHDSRDNEIARKIAIGMGLRRCSVWYDEFMLRAGDNLRDSIEKGIKECRKCIIVLSTNFFANGGWTKKEFDSIFTREILEETNLIPCLSG